MADRGRRKGFALRQPLTAFIGTLQDGRALQGLFLGMLALVVVTLGVDLNDLIARGPDGPPGSQRLEPAPMQLPQPGDQTRPYLPRTMPLGPGRGRPDLPGYSGPLDQGVMAEPMQFLRGGEDRVTAIGRIDPGAAARLESFLGENEKQISEIVLHSPGGSVSDALAMSRAIRAAGISTRVPDNGYCASSCPLLLAGGLYREAGETAFIGVHQIYAPQPATGSLQRGMSDAQSVTALAQRLLNDMGVDSRLWNHALVTPPADLYVFRPEELLRYRLANVRRPVTQPTARPDAGA